jgi:CMP-N-acetylneuraminic acid synthetase
MYKNKRVLAVVPARGGSKGVKLKNLHPLCGEPLIAHTGRTIREIECFDRAVVSTDHEAIAEAAEEYGIAAPWRRPESLSGDRIGDWDVLEHALRATEELDGVLYDVVVMLQPTSPLRKNEEVRACIEKLVDGNWDAVWTVSPTDLKYHPLKALVIDDEGAMDLYDPRGREIIARQQLMPIYHRNGGAYALTRQCVLEQKTTIGERWSAVICEEAMVSIDTLEDFEKVEKVMRQQSDAES